MGPCPELTLTDNVANPRFFPSPTFPPPTEEMHTRPAMAISGDPSRYTPRLKAPGSHHKSQWHLHLRPRGGDDHNQHQSECKIQRQHSCSNVATRFTSTGLTPITAARSSVPLTLASDTSAAEILTPNRPGSQHAKSVVPATAVWLSLSVPQRMLLKKTMWFVTLV